MRSELIGRDDELAVLGGVLDGLTTRSAVAIIRGEAGIGKTVLVSAVLEDADAAQLRILRGACAPMSRGLAYGALDAALSPEGAEEAYSSAVAGRARVVESMLTSLKEIARDGAVLFVEDVHWADTSTLDFLAYLSRNLPLTGLLVLLTWRDEALDEEHRRWIGEQLRNPAVVDLPLRRLTLDETARQLARCSPATVAQVHRRSAGNPYLSVELARGGSHLTGSLRQVLLSRLEGVSPGARTVVAAAATLGRPLTDDDLLVAVSGDMDVVREAHEAGLMVRDSAIGSVARHPVLGELAYEGLMARDRRLLHSRIADHLLTSLDAEPTAAAVAEIAEQYRRTDDPNATLVWSLRAAQSAERSFAIAEAGHWYATAASAWDSAHEARRDAPEKLSLLNSAATHLASVGQLDRAVALLDGDLSGSDPLVVRAALTRSWLWTALGDTTRALQDVDVAEQRTTRRDDANWARICVQRAMALGTCSRWDEAAEPARTAFGLGERVGEIRTVGTAHVLLGVQAAAAGRWTEAKEHYEAALAIARRIAEPDDVVMAALVLTDLSWRTGDADEAVRLAAIIRPEVRRLMLGRHWLEDIVDGNVVAALYEAGRWDEALAWSTDASDLGLLQPVVAEIHLARGELAVAEELLNGAARVLERDQPQFLGLYAEARAGLLLRTGRPEEALQLALSNAEKLHGTLSEVDGCELLLVGLEAAVDVSDPERLERLVALLGAAAEGRAGAALTAVVDGERSRVVGVPDPGPWVVAATAWAAIGRPYDAARAHFRAAEAYLAGRAGIDARRSAAEHLQAAARLARDLGAAPLAEDVRQLSRLARIEVEHTPTRQHRARRSEPTGSDTAWPPVLTDRERQVLALLAEGLTNREIGDALYMSPKTASVHVTHILEKFGVQSRVQAAAMAARFGLDRRSAVSD